jgi:hypothetical protein
MAAVLVEHGGNVGQLGGRRPDQLGNDRNHELTLQLAAAGRGPRDSGITGLLNATSGHAALRAADADGVLKESEFLHSRID